MKSNVLQECNDVYSGTYYGSPTRRLGDNTSELFTALNEEICMFKNKEVTLVQGDFNAITGNSKDFIEHDKFGIVLGIENLNNQHIRNSEVTLRLTPEENNVWVCAN